MKGTPVSLIELGVALPDDWEICAAVAYRHPVDSESVDGFTTTIPSSRPQPISG